MVNTSKAAVLRNVYVPWYLLLPLWLACSAAHLASAATAPQLSGDSLAIIKLLGDEPVGGSFFQFVAQMERDPDVVVVRVALKGSDADYSLAERKPIQLAFNGQSNIAVIYPDIGEPYRSIFFRIIEGIEDRTQAHVASYAVTTDQSAADLTAQLHKQNIRVVIALGRVGIKATANLDRSIALIVGGVLSLPESETIAGPVFSLAPDPTLLFDRLKSMMPTARRIIVIYDPRQNAWLIRLAREAARNAGMELISREAGDLKSAMYLYQEYLATADPKRDVLWLPQDSVTVEESTVLPFVLQEAWRRSLLVFSSSVSHVKRGALFSLYPDNIELGRSMAATALGQNPASPGGRTVTPLRDVLMAVNLRTAGHLGVNVAEQKRSFDLVFPEP